MLEVLIALVILMASLGALSSQMMVGVRSANRTQLQTKAVTICRSILSEQCVTPSIASTAPSRVDGQPDWMVQTTVQPIPGNAALLGSCDHEKMILISVTAWQNGKLEAVSKTTLHQIARQKRLVGATGLEDQGEE